MVHQQRAKLNSFFPLTLPRYLCGDVLQNDLAALWFTLVVAQCWVGAGHQGPGVPTRCGAAPFAQTGGNTYWHQCPGRAEV